MATLLRKHSAAFIAAAVYNFVLFFPVLFMGRVISPNDVFYNTDPWAMYRTERVQNSLINDPPTSYFTLMALMKSEPDAFDWNPYVASGIPGFGSSASAILSPFVSIPTLLLPLTWIFTAIVFLKLNVAFFFAYLWLREEHLGKRGAAIGAIVIAGAGIYAVRWLWQTGNATALYPALLWLVRRMFNGRRNSIALMSILALSYALAGFPAMMAYGAYLVASYTLFLIVRERRFPFRALGAAAAAVAIALLIALPSLIPYVQLIGRSGYLETRETASMDRFFPLAHARSFLDAERLGNPALKSWLGDPTLGQLNNMVESTIYVGLVAIPLLLFALLNRRTRSRWFWIASLLFILGCMFGVGFLPRLVGNLPGVKYSALVRVGSLLPLAVGYLAAAGAAVLVRTRGRWRFVTLVATWALAVAASADLAVFAGRFYPYLTPERATVPATPTIQHLLAQPRPFRIAPMFNYFWPNSAELFRIEDVRSHFGSEAVYRRMLERVDPTSRLEGSYVISFNSLKFDFADPLVSMLGVRYFIEHRSIDIIKWGIFSNTKPGVKEMGVLKLKPGQVAERTVRVDEEPFWSIELPLSIEATSGHTPRVSVSLIRYGNSLWSREFTPDDIGVLGKVYIPLRPYARLGDSVKLRIEPIGVTAGLLRGANDLPGEAPVFYGRVMTPVMFDRELPDGRLFINAGELPRFRAAARTRRMTVDQLLATKAIDFEQEAIVTDARANLSLPQADGALVRLIKYGPAEQLVETESAQPFFLASSEKLTPELRVEIDGREADPVEINALFAGVAVPPGSHKIVFTRRIARGWWWVAGVGLAVWVAVAGWEVARAISARRRG